MLTIGSTRITKMQLFVHSQKPSPRQREIIEEILSHAEPPIKIADLFRNRPNHQVSSWRKLVCWCLHRKYDVAQKQLALWFQLHTVTVCRLIKGVDEIVAGGSPGGDETREVISKIIPSAPSDPQA